MDETEKKKPGRKPGTPKTGGRPKGMPKTGGRKSGTPNKITKAVRERLEDIIVDRFDNLAAALDKIYEDGDNLGFAAMMAKFVPYIAPRLNNIDINDNSNKDKSLEEQLSQMAEEHD